MPDHHAAAVENLLHFAAEFDPDQVLILGDFLDMKGPARWSRGLAEEYQSDLQADCDMGVEILTGLRDVYQGPIDYIEGNHEKRIRSYLAKYAPALNALRDVRLPKLLAFDDLDITYRAQPYQLGNGWVAIHGDRIAPYGGGSAMKMAKRFGASVVQGHTHRLGQITETTGYAGRAWDLTAVECGHLSDVNKAAYVGFGSANWQMGFALLNLGTDGRVQPELIPVDSTGAFTVHGVDFTAHDDGLVVTESGDIALRAETLDSIFLPPAATGNPGV